MASPRKAGITRSAGGAAEARAKPGPGAARPGSSRDAAAIGSGLAAATGREIELKLKLRTRDIPLLRARLDRLGKSRQQHVDNVYYDTPDLRLAQARAALRLRSVGGGGRRRWVQTFKTEDMETPLAVRGEWESPAPGGRLDVARLSHSPLAQLLGGLSGHGPEDGLAPVFRTVFDRSCWDLRFVAARIEAAIDLGEIQAHGHVETIREIELELRAGEPAALFDLALHLCHGRAGGGGADAALSLVPYGASKAARGYRLARNQDPVEPVPGLPRRGSAAPGRASFAPDQPAPLAARQWLLQTLEALLANVHGAGVSDDPEFVHQARIALRLMRVGADLLSAPADLPQSLPEAMQEWAKPLGEVREWDVICSQVLPGLRRRLGKGASTPWKKLRDAANARQAAARVDLRRRLEAPAFAEFALRLMRWGATTPREPGQGLAEFAHRALRRRRRRLAKGVESFSQVSMARQHKIRLQAKNLRYAEQMLHAVLPGSLAGPRLRALVRFQDAAGRARDLALARTVLRSLTRAKPLRRELDDWLEEERRKGEAAATRLSARLQRH